MIWVVVEFVFYIERIKGLKKNVSFVIKIKQTSTNKIIERIFEHMILRAHTHSWCMVLCGVVVAYMK